MNFPTTYIKKIIDIKKNRQQEREKLYQLLTLLFLLLFLFQLGAMVYVNLTQMQYHVGYDASSYYLKAVEIWKQKTLLIGNWSEPTTLSLDSPVPLAALFYGITDDIFLSYGMANILVVAALLYTFYRILQHMNLDTMPKLISLNFLLCPFVTYVDNLNDLGYFACMITSFNAYGVKMLIVLMVIRAVMEIQKKQIRPIYLILTVVLCFGAGFSSGLSVLAFGIFPCIIYGIVKMLIENDCKAIKNKELLFPLLCGAATVAGKIGADKLIGFEALDSSMTLMSLNSFWNNLQAIFLGLMKLMGAMPLWAEVKLQNPMSTVFLSCLFLFCVLAVGFIGAVIIIVKRVKKDYDSNCLLLIVVIATNIGILSVIYTLYEKSTIIESRYLLPVFLCMIPLCAKWIQGLNFSQLVTKLGLVLTAFCLIYSSAVGNRNYIQNKINTDLYKRIIEQVEQTDSRLIYMWGSKLNVDGRNLRVFDTDRVYKLLTETGEYHHWSDYTYYDSKEEYKGEVLFLSATGDTTVPSEIKEEGRLIAVIDQYELYYLE